MSDFPRPCEKIALLYPTFAAAQLTHFRLLQCDVRYVSRKGGDCTHAGQAYLFITTGAQGRRGGQRALRVRVSDFWLILCLGLLRRLAFGIWQVITHHPQSPIFTITLILDPHRSQLIRESSNCPSGLTSDILGLLGSSHSSTLTLTLIFILTVILAVILALTCTAQHT